MSTVTTDSTVSRLLAKWWAEEPGGATLPAPYEITQDDDVVYVYAGWPSLGWAANILAVHGNYRIEYQADPDQPWFVSRLAVTALTRLVELDADA